MIQINENTKVSADDNGYSLHIRKKVSEHGKEVAKRFGNIAGEYINKPTKYSSSLHGIFSIYIEDRLQDMAQSEEIYTMKEVMFKINQLKDEFKDKLTYIYKR